MVKNTVSEKLCPVRPRRYPARVRFWGHIVKRRNLTIFALCMTLACGLAKAGPFDDAQAALAKEDYAAAARLYAFAATQGDVRAQTMLGMFYRTGQGGITQDQNKANEWFKLAADKNWSPAQLALGESYAYGWGVRQSWREAIRLYTLAANQGLAAAQTALGNLYGKGDGVTRDYKKAIEWYLRAAKQGDMNAQFDLGYLFSQGLGADQNLALAATYYGQAAQQGNASAQSALGFQYSQGNGVPQDYAMAFKLFQQAAVQGNTLGQAMLGDAYAFGRGTTKDEVRGYMWLNLATADSGSAREDVVSMRDTAASRLYPAQVEQAQAMGRRCLESHFVDCGPDSIKPGDQVAAAGGSQPNNQPQESPPAQDEKDADPNEPHYIGNGSGFFVSAKGHVITNMHVIQQCSAVRSPKAGFMKVVAWDEESDLALLVGDDTTPESFAHLRGGRGVRAGENVVAVGFPLYGMLGRDPIVTAGVISSLSGPENDRRVIQFSAPIQPGNSGGPVIGEDGSVVGVTVSTLSTVEAVKEIGGAIPQNINFAVSMGTLQSFLNAHSIPYVLDSGSAKLSTADISAEAADYTVLLECWKVGPVKDAE